MKRLVIAAILVAVVNGTALGYEELQGVPNIGQLKEIDVREDGLMLTIFPNGSGIVRSGTEHADVTTIPQQTFSFAKIYRTLLPGLNLKNDRERVYTSAFTGLGNQAYNFSIRNRVISRLLADAGVKYKSPADDTE